MTTPKQNLPIIGITLDHEEPGSYSNMPWYALRENHVAPVRNAGGLAMLLPHEATQVDAYLDAIDGLMVTGGNFDVDPALFGAAQRHEKVTTKEARTRFEFDITRGAFERDMPVLGICGGQQLLNVVLGGTLIQHIPDEVDSPLAHEQPNPRTQPGHDVKVTKGTLLHTITGTHAMSINSAHHQAVAKVGDGVIVNAVAEDGVIEGIEAVDKTFCLGVQWHPEYLIDPGDGKIIGAFVEAARTYKKSR